MVGTGYGFILTACFGIRSYGCFTCALKKEKEKKKKRASC
jgi:hypothetical protein